MFDINSKLTKCKACGSDISKQAKKCPQCGHKNSNTRNTLGVAVLVLGVLLLFVALFSDTDNTPSRENASNTNTVSPTPAPIEISAVDLYDTYTENEVNADNLYKNKTIAITGVITEIGKDLITDAPFIALDSGSAFSLYPVQCFFPKSSESSAALAELRDGQTITVIGRCTGKAIIHVQLTGCKLADE